MMRRTEMLDRLSQLVQHYSFWIRPQEEQEEKKLPIEQEQRHAASKRKTDALNTSIKLLCGQSADVSDWMIDELYDIGKEWSRIFVLKLDDLLEPTESFTFSGNAENELTPHEFYQKEAMLYIEALKEAISYLSKKL